MEIKRGGEQVEGGLGGAAQRARLSRAPVAFLAKKEKGKEVKGYAGWARPEGKKKERLAGLGWCGGREKKEKRMGQEKEKKGAGLERKPERGPEEGFCFKKRKDGFY
jgi:hypothetical protein